MNEIYINPETGELFEVSADKKDQFLIDFPNAVLQTEEEKPEEITTEMFVNPDNGEQFEVSIDKKDLFLQDFPNAVPIDQAGKQTPSAQDAVAGENKASDTDLQSEDGSLDLQKTKEKDEIGVIESLSGKLARGFASTGKGLLSAAEAIAFGMANIWDQDMTTEEKIALKQAISTGVYSGPTTGLGSSDLKKAEDWASSHVRNLESESIYEAISNGNIADAAELTVGGALESAPSILAAMTGYGGIALFGTSVAGNKFDEEFEKNPDESLKVLYANAAGNGVIEAGFELVTRGLLKKAGLIEAKSGVDIAKAFLADGAKSLVKKIGWTATQEGASEAATEITSMLWDAYGGLDKKIEKGEFVTRVFDAGVIGAFMGGGMSTLSEIGGTSKAARNRAESLLTPIQVKKMYADASVKLSSLMKDIQNPETTPEQRNILEKEIQKIQANIATVKGDVSKTLEGLNQEELVENFNLINEIEENVIAYNEVKDKKTSKAKVFKQNIQDAQQKQSDLFKLGVERQLLKSIEFLEKNASKIKSEVEILKTAEEVEKKYGKEAAESDGLISTKTGKITINEEVALKQKAVSVGSHELLHGILFKAIGVDPDPKIIEEFKKRLTPEQRAVVQQRLEESYNEDEFNREYLTVFSDAINKNQIKFKENIFTKIGDFITPILRAVGFKNIEFNNGKDVYDFMREYQKNIKQGKISKSVVKAIAEKEATKKEEELVKSVTADLNKKVDDLVGEKDASGNYKYKSKEEFQSSEEFVNAYDEIINGKLLDGLILKGIEGRDVYGVSLEDFIEQVKSGVSSASSSAQGSLTDILLKFDPTKNNSLIGYINSLLSYKKGDLLKKLKKQQTKSIDVAAGETGSIAELEADDTSEALLEESMAEERRQSGLIKAEEILSKDFVKAATEEVVSKLAQITPKDLTFKNVKGLAVDTLAKEIGIPAKKIMDTTANMSSQEMGVSINWIKQHANQIAKIMPQGAVLDSASEKLLGTATGIANSVLKNPKLYTKNPRIKKGPGLSPFVKNKNIKGEDVLNAIGIVNGEPKPGIGPRTPEGQAVKGILAMYEKLVSNSLLRQELIDQGESLNVIQDIGAGKSELMFSKNVGSDLTLLGNKDGLLFIQFSKTKRAEYENILKNNRPDLKDIPKQVENLFEWADSLNVKDNKKAKYKKLALFYMNKGNLILPEDGYKVEEAIRLSEINKIDPYSFQNVDELIEKYTPVTKTARINPDTVKEFTNKKELSDGVVVYDVNPSKEGQIAVRKVIDSNWGEKANPWCLAARIEEVIEPIDNFNNNIDGLSSSFIHWKNYNLEKNGYKIAFQNGKLKSFRDGNDKNWWDRRDEASKGIKIEGKIGDDGFLPTLELKEDGSKKIIGYQKGSLNDKNGEVIFKNAEGVITGIRDFKNGKLEGYYLESTEYDGIITTVEGNYVEGERDGTFTQTETPVKVDDESVGDVTVGRLDKGDSVDITSVTNKITIVEYKKNKIFSMYSMTYASLLDSGEKIIYTAYGPYEGGIGIIDPDTRNVADDLMYSKTLGANLGGSNFNLFFDKDKKKIGLFKRLVNKNPEKIEEYYLKIYGGVFPNIEKYVIEELKESIANWKKIKGDKISASEFVIQDVLQNASKPMLRSILNLGRGSLDFRNENQVNSAEKALVSLANKLSIEDLAKYLLPTVGLSKNQTDEKLRYFLTKGREDFINKINEVNKNKIKYNNKEQSFVYNGEKINIKSRKFQKTSGYTSGNFKTKERVKYALDERKGLEKISNALKELLKTKEITPNDVGMILMSFSSFDLGIIRTSAVPDLEIDTKKKFGTDLDYRYEHKKPSRKITGDLAKLIADKPDAISFSEIMKDYRVAIIPKVYDDIINKFYKDFSPIEQDQDRYNNRKVNEELKKQGLPRLKIKEIQYSKSKQEDLTFSKNLNREFNDILQATTGVDSKKTYSKIGAEMAGSKKGKFDFFIPPGAEDFIGLIYKTLGKGEIGDRQLAWYKENFFDPYARAMAAVTKDRVVMAQKFKDLRKQLNIVPKNLRKKLPGEGFTQEQAVRVYIWTKQGEKIPGLNEGDLSTLNDYVKNNPELKEFGDRLIAIAGKDAYVAPREGWTAGTITTDLLDTVNGSKRAMHLEQWQDNVNAVFTEENLNKLEALYGKSYRVALENILKRMKSGRNRLFTSDSLTGRFVDWISNSIGSIMFFNSRSAILQTISSINFINFTDNNIIAAGKALANPKQFASDFMKLMNSEFLVDRRNGLRINVNEADIANIAATSKNKAKAFISEMLKLGFLPTQIADSFAIASGGAAFYRNRINTYLKQGLNQTTAEQNAMRDFREIAEESQQSSRPDKISQQQAGPLGRIILAFANTPAQYARIIKKAALDLKNGRGDRKTNISKIVYYGVAQNLLFSAMQNALFALMFDGDDDEEKAEEENKKYGRVANSMADSLLRGMGFAGAVTSVVKNAALKIVEESNKDIPKYEKAAKELIKISPPISSKLSKVESALRSASWDRDKIKEAGLSIDNPAYMIGGKLSSAAFNIPLDRALTKVDNIQNAMSKETEIWQKFALLAGWQSWELGIEDEDDKTKRGSTKRKTSERKTVKRKTVKRNK